jgi:RNA polymerase sigma-70 factor, ECF subfamily
MDESDLNNAMDRYACGDAQAFGMLHRALFPRLLAYLARMSGSPALADDLVQETFLRMHRARSTFASGGAVLPWAYAIARNVHIDHARSAKLRTTERLPSDPGPELVDASGGDAESAAIAAEAARVVERVLASLPPAQREAFVLIRYEGLSIEDAAGVVGATQTAVKLRAFRAYEALRAALQEFRARRDSPPPAAAKKAQGRARAAKREQGGADGRS